MSKTYNVTTVAQTSNNTCWHASSLMIWYYWQSLTNKQGPMNTIADNYKDDQGVTPQQFVNLAGKIGLKKIFQIPTYCTSQRLEEFLVRYGPLWCAGFWYGVGHIIVLTGVDGEKIFFNDPDGGFKKEGTVTWFNTKLSKEVDGCVMYKDPHAY
jgi:ABC-type bacteriocin/lantibiotic exporter with double-glycine peptidase domain